MVKIVERRIARLEIRNFSVKQVEGKYDQSIAKICLGFAESFSQNPVSEFRCGEITLGMEHLLLDADHGSSKAGGEQHKSAIASQYTAILKVMVP
jgi:hypothetical protein